MAQIAGEELLGALIIFACALGITVTRKNEDRGGQTKPVARASFHRISPRRKTFGPFSWLATAVVLFLRFWGTHEGDRSDPFVEQSAVEGRQLFFDEVLIAALRFGQVFVDGLQNCGGGVSGW